MGARRRRQEGKTSGEQHERAQVRKTKRGRPVEEQKEDKRGDQRFRAEGWSATHAKSERAETEVGERETRREGEQEEGPKRGAGVRRQIGVEARTA